MADALAISWSMYTQLVAGEPAEAMRAWNGEVWGPKDAPATIVLNHSGALRALFLPFGDLTAGEAYIDEDVDIGGSILAAPPFAARLQPMQRRRLTSLRLIRQLRLLPAENRRSRYTRPEKRGRPDATLVAATVTASTVTHNGATKVVATATLASGPAR